MRIWAIADLHLSFGVPSKSMEAFGLSWKEYAQKMERAWKACVQSQDLVLIAGDISWAMTVDEVKKDLEWIDQLPGKKVILKGNHDYWWPSSSKLKQILPPSIEFIYNNALTLGDVTIGGSRLWDSSEYNFHSFILFQENPKAKLKEETPPQEEEKIFLRELERLKISLKQLSVTSKYRIAMTHYPPIGANLNASRVSDVLEEFKIQYCVFGHLHNVKPKSLPFGTARGVKYVLTACDYLDFIPYLLLEI